MAKMGSFNVKIVFKNSFFSNGIEKVNFEGVNFESLLFKTGIEKVTNKNSIIYLLF